MIRYAPYIDGTIPAFTDETGIVVPFTPNKAVGKDAAAGMALKISNLDGNLVGGLTSKFLSNNIANFTLNNSLNLSIGQYYKLQLAYIDTLEFDKTKNLFKKDNITNIILFGLRYNIKDEKFFWPENDYNSDNEENPYYIYYFDSDKTLAKFNYNDCEFAINYENYSFSFIDTSGNTLEIKFNFNESRIQQFDFNYVPEKNELPNGIENELKINDSLFNSYLEKINLKLAFFDSADCGKFIQNHKKYNHSGNIFYLQVTNLDNTENSYYYFEDGNNNEKAIFLNWNNTQIPHHLVLQIKNSDKNYLCQSNDKLTYSTVGITKYIGSRTTLDITNVTSTGLEFNYECDDSTESLDKYELQVCEETKIIEGKGIVRIDDVSPLEHEMVVELKSKNLLDSDIFLSYFDKQEDGSYLSNQYIKVDMYFPLYLPKGTYTFSVTFKNPVSCNYRPGIKYEDGTTYPFPYMESTGEYQYLAHTLTTDKAIQYLYWGNGGPTSNELQFKDFQIEVSTETTAYTPYVDISTVTLKKYGRNLFDTSKLLTEGGWKEENGIYSGKASDLQGKYDVNTNGYMSLEGIENATISFYAHNDDSPLTDKNGLVVFFRYHNKDIGYADVDRRIAVKGPNDIFYKLSSLANEKLEKLCFSYGKYGEDHYLHDIQLEIGAGTEYEPYIEPTIYTADANGVVKGVTNLYPTTTLIADNPNVEISCSYISAPNPIYTQSNGFNKDNKIDFTYPLLNGKNYGIILKGNTINNHNLLDTYYYFKENNIISLPTFKGKDINRYEYGENNFEKDNQYKLIRSLNDSPSFYSIVNNPDNTIEHGKKYYYGLMNDSGDWSLDGENPIITYFEDMFLQDATHTLRIKFNPKVSSFKTNIQESKQETLGGRFPFFFRNGDGYYNEFPISGLVSYHMNDSGKFMNDSKLGLVENSSERSNTNSTGVIEDKVRTTNLTDYNITAERNFKLAVLEWLNNGQPKLFRSPTEGNYVVKLMNISLSPEERLGRMLHTFNATAVECAAADYETLVALNLVRKSEV